MKSFEKEAYGYIKDMFVQHNMIKRVVMTVISIVVMGFGISLFSVSGFGVDPFTSMNMNVAGALGIGYGTYQLIVNAIIIVFVVIVAHRGSNSLNGSNSSVLNLFTSLSFIKMYDNVSFNPKSHILCLIFLIVLSTYPIFIGTTGNFPSMLFTP